MSLFEEDEQSKSETLAGDGSEALAVFPFGRDAGDQELSIEVAPVLVSGPAPAAPEIHIDDPGPDGWMRIDAATVPGALRIDAEIVRAGVVLASGSATAHADEPVSLELSGQTERAELTAVVDAYDACPREIVGFTFDLDRTDAGGARRSIATGWAGKAVPGAQSEYPLTQWQGGAVLRVRFTSIEEAR